MHIGGANIPESAVDLEIQETYIQSPGFQNYNLGAMGSRELYRSRRVDRDTLPHAPGMVPLVDCSFNPRAPHAGRVRASERGWCSKDEKRGVIEISDPVLSTLVKWVSKEGNK